MDRSEFLSQKIEKNKLLNKIKKIGNCFLYKM